jgi:hypothetical protein
MTKRRGHYTAGIKAESKDLWGWKTAQERYGAPRPSVAPPKDRSEPQFNQGPKVWGGNDVDGRKWTRAPGEDATKKPNFDKMKNGRH